MSPAFEKPLCQLHPSKGHGCRLLAAVGAGSHPHLLCTGSCPLARQPGTSDAVPACRHRSTASRRARCTSNARRSRPASSLAACSAASAFRQSSSSSAIVSLSWARQGLPGSESGGLQCSPLIAAEHVPASTPASSFGPQAWSAHAACSLMQLGPRMQPGLRPPLNHKLPALTMRSLPISVLRKDMVLFSQRNCNASADRLAFAAASAPTCACCSCMVAASTPAAVGRGREHEWRTCRAGVPCARRKDGRVRRPARPRCATPGMPAPAPAPR